MSEILVVIGIIFLAYYIAMLIYAGYVCSFTNFWLFLGTGFLCFGLVYTPFKIGVKLLLIPRIVLLVASILMIIGMMFFIIIVINIIVGMLLRNSTKVDYIIVLGAKISGRRLSKILIKRLDGAIYYIKDTPNVVIIVSGAQGKGEDISEAQAMHEYLLNRGISKENIIIEDKSYTTEQNLINSRQIINDDSKVVGICSSNFHIYRAVLMAKYVGFENVIGMPTSSSPLFVPNYVVREFCAMIKWILRKKVF